MSGVFMKRVQHFTAARSQHESIQSRKPTVDPQQTIADKVYTSTHTHTHIG